MKNNRPRFRLAAGLVIGLLSLAIGLINWRVWTSHRNERDFAISQSEMRAVQFASAVAERMKVFVHGVDFALRQVRRDYGVDDARFQVVAKSVLGAFPEGSLLQLSIANANGELIYSTFALPERISIRDREHFKVHLDGRDRLFISKPIVGRVSKEWSVQFSRPILRNGSFAGVAILSIAPSYISKALASFEMEPDDFISLRDIDGTFFARSHKLEAVLGNAFSTARPFMRPDAPLKGVYRDASVVDGRNRIFAWQRLPDTPLVVNVALDTGTILAPLDIRFRREWSEAEVVSGGLVVLGVMILWLLARLSQQQTSLSHSEQRLRAVLDQSIAAMYVLQDNKIVYANPRMHKIFGYAAKEVFNPDPLAHVKESDWPKVIEQIQRRLVSESKAAYSVTALRKDGAEFTLGVNATRAVYEGKPAIVAVAQDITEKVRAEEVARRYVEGIKEAMESTVDVVSIIGEIRDPYTHGHERRVGELAAAIGIEMGLDADRVEGIRVAGHMHDVGKISVPAEILAKPTRLTAAEFELVKGHAQQSYEILKRVHFPWPVAQVALQHHERIDGSGYPQGLKGDAIILEARITAVADVVEAMASHRPYRPGLGIEKALAEIERGRGVIYDSAVADACVRLFRDKGYTIPA